MSQKRLDSAIKFSKPSTLKDLQSFLGLVNYFKDHLRDHSLIARPLYQMVANATKLINKALTWDEATTDSFDKRKE